MQTFSEKMYLILTPPSEDDPVSDHERIRIWNAIPVWQINCPGVKCDLVTENRSKPVYDQPKSSKRSLKQ